MITYYLDNTTVPTHPRLVRRVNNGHPRRSSTTPRARPWQMDAVNLQFTYDISNGASNPGNVEMVTARPGRRRRVHAQPLRAHADSQGQRGAHRPIAEQGCSRGISSSRTPWSPRSACAAWRSWTIGSRMTVDAGDGFQEDEARDENDVVEVKRTGMAIITALLVLMLASGLMAGMFAALLADQRSHATDRDQSQAYAAAHAGLEKLTASLGCLFNNRLQPERRAAQRRRQHAAGDRRASITPPRAARRLGLRDHLHAGPRAWRRTPAIPWRSRTPTSRPGRSPASRA